MQETKNAEDVSKNNSDDFDPGLGLELGPRIKTVSREYRVEAGGQVAISTITLVIVISIVVILILILILVLMIISLRWSWNAVWSNLEVWFSCRSRCLLNLLLTNLPSAF